VLQTEDIFLASYGLVRGGQLEGVEVHGINNRRLAVFRIVGPDMDQVAREYHQGRSLVDLRLLKVEVARLKDLAFEALRKERRDGSQRVGFGPHQAAEPDRGRRF
jgi:hypothetical protein